MDFMHPYTGHNLNKKDDLQEVSRILFLARDYKVCFNHGRYIISLAKNRL